MNASTATIPDTARLVNELSAQLADAVILPAVEALGERRAARIRERVLPLVQAGKLDVAHGLVDDEIRLYVIQRELTAHVTDCYQCCLPGPTCMAYARLERRENALLNLVANAGGLR